MLWLLDNIEHMLNKFLYFILAILSLGAIGWLYHKQFTPFSFTEFITLVVVGAVSTTNYRRTAQIIENVTDKLTRFYLYTFATFNVLFFLLAILFLHKVEVHILMIVLIYSCFSFTNINQVYRLSKIKPDANTSDDKKTEWVIATVLGATWLKEENGIAIIAYTTVILAIWILPMSNGKWQWLHIDANQDVFRKLLEAFAGGAATFHLALSVIKYTLSLRKDDVTEETLRALQWNPAKEDKITGIARLFHGWLWTIIAFTLAAIVLTIVLLNG
jgi:hypothetical protein